MVKTQENSMMKIMSESERKTRRVRHDIVSEILEIALKGSRKTHIMYRTNLS